LADLAEIRRYSRKEWGSEQADAYLRGLGEVFRRIAEDRARTRSADHIRPGYRQLRYRSHLIFVRLSADAADVVRVLHAKQDHAAHLASADDEDQA
jgi:toxin ParE1/3/4